jgi:hypothetical protein
MPYSIQIAIPNTAVDITIDLHSNSSQRISGDIDISCPPASRITIQTLKTSTKKFRHSTIRLQIEQNSDGHVHSNSSIRPWSKIQATTVYQSKVLPARICDHKSHVKDVRELKEYPTGILIGPESFPAPSLSDRCKCILIDSCNDRTDKLGPICPSVRNNLCPNDPMPSQQITSTPEHRPTHRPARRAKARSRRITTECCCAVEPACGVDISSHPDHLPSCHPPTDSSSQPHDTIIITGAHPRGEPQLVYSDTSAHDRCPSDANPALALAAAAAAAHTTAVTPAAAAEAAAAAAHTTTAAAAAAAAAARTLATAASGGAAAPAGRPPRVGGSRLVWARLAGCVAGACAGVDDSDGR